MGMDEGEAPSAGEVRPLVDITLVDAMLALTAEERLRQNDRMIRTIQELRDAFAAQRSYVTGHQAGRRGC